MEEAHKGTVSPADLNRAVVESKVYTASEFAHMQQEIDDLKAQLDREDTESARATLSSHIGMIVVGGLIAAAIGGVGMPALIAAGIAATPPIAQELVDFHAVEKGRGRKFLAHPIQEVIHGVQAVRNLRHPKTAPKPLAETSPLVASLMRKPPPQLPSQKR